MNALLQRLLWEPLIHFALLGGLIFAVYLASTEASAPPANVIVIASERLDQIADEFESVWKRRPEETEFEALIEEEIREEVYYREALALGLDRNDAIVRRRMRLKMEFLMDSAAEILEPSAGELERYFEANEEMYQLEPRVAFEQIYLGEEASAERVAGALSGLASSPAIDPATLGQRTFLPTQLGLSTANVVFGVFGKGFFEQVVELPTGVWAGPATSTFGVHLVRVLDGLPARTPRFEEVRGDVLRDWKLARANEIHDRDYAERRARFAVEVERHGPMTQASP